MGYLVSVRLDTYLKMETWIMDDYNYMIVINVAFLYNFKISILYKHSRQRAFLRTSDV